MSSLLAASLLVAVFGFDQVLAGARVIVLWFLVLICLTLAILALLAPVSSILPLRRRGFGDWL